MKLTTELLAPYIGGQIEIQNRNESYLYRGEIDTAEVSGSCLQVTLKWLALGVDFPPIPSKWVVSSTKNYAVDLNSSAVSNIASSGEEIGGGDRICINTHPAIGELIVLYPANGSKLDPAKIEGLTLAPQAIGIDPPETPVFEDDGDRG